MQTELTSSQMQSLYVVSQDKDLFVTIQQEIVHILRYEARKTGNEATYGTLRCIMGICTAHLHSYLSESIKQRMKSSL